MADRPRRTVLRNRALALMSLGVLAAAVLTGASMVTGAGFKPVVSVLSEGGLSYSHHGSAALVKASVKRDQRILRCAALAFKGTRGAGCGPLRDYPGAPRKGVQRSAALSDTGSWSQPFQYPPASLLAGGGGSGNPAIAIHQIVLPTGKVLFLSYPFTNYTTATNMASYAWLWDPSLGTGPGAFKEVDPPINPATNLPFNLWCGGQTVLPDGRVVIVGGTLRYENKTVKTNGTDPDNHLGLNVIVTFNPFTETWALQQTPTGNSKLMVSGRWYPTLVTLPDGRVVIMSGRDSSIPDNGATVAQVEVFTPSPNMDGTNGSVAVAPSSADRVTALYPHLFLLPDNTAAGAGSSAQFPKILLAGPGKTSSNDSAILDTRNWTWTNLPPLDGNRDYGTAVLMPGSTSGSTEVRLIGGGTMSVKTSLRLDLSNPGAGWLAAPAMSINRSHFNTTILPDGSLFSFGGGLGVVNSPNKENPNAPYVGAIGDNYQTTGTNPPQEWTSELWTPSTNTWKQVATQHDNRTYHSTGVLLPDGTVLSAGDDRPTHQPLTARTAEIYSPPYLFNGPRPTIASAPIQVGYGQSFLVGTGDQVSSAVLVAPAAVTHANDMDQRSIKLAVTPAAGGVVLSTPADQTVLPPRYYMLFLLNAQGVPSVAKWVKVDPSTAAPIFATPAPDGGAAAAGGGGAAAGGAGATVPGKASAASVKTAPAVKVSLSKVTITRRGRALTARFTLRGKTAFSGHGAPRPARVQVPAAAAGRQPQGERQDGQEGQGRPGLALDEGPEDQGHAAPRPQGRPVGQGRPRHHAEPRARRPAGPLTLQ